MTKIDLSLDLPDRVAREAKEAGLLSARAVAQLLRAEIRRRAASRLNAGAERASAKGSKPLSMAELQNEIDAARKERRSGTRPAG
jgi:hypothetical protein